MDITADASGVRRGVDDAERSLARLNSVGTRTLKGLGVTAVATGAAFGAGLAAAIATGTRELLEQEKASAQTTAAIKSTGGAANVTKKEIEGMASGLQALTGQQDDAIQSGANLLLTFTNIRNEAGQGNDVFNQATRTLLDMSVAMGTDMSSQAIQLGKALNDPIAGVSALAEVGVTFTNQQKEQIATLVESGKSMEAQKLILKELNKEFGGSGRALGESTAGMLMRIQRAWESVSQGLVREFLPDIEGVADGVLRNMDKVRSFFDGVAVAVRGTISFLKALFRGDWKKAWDIAADGIGKALDAGLTIAEEVLLPAARKLGEKMAGALADGLRAGLRAAPGGRYLDNALFGDPTPGPAVVPTWLGGSGAPRGANPGYIPGSGPGLATGGLIPGRYDARDDVPVRLSRGEVVLNPTQQRMVGIDRIMGTLRATGAVIGGDGFAAGGIVGDAFQRATSKLGTPYRYGEWDCSKFATYVAGVGVGGSTATAWRASRPARGDEPIVWGFRNRANNDVYDGGPDEHMGVRVNGQWFDNGSGGVQSNSDSTRWEHVRVPNGLESIAASTDTRANTRGQGTSRLSPREQVSRLLGLALGVGANFGPGPTSRTVSNLVGGVPDYSGGLAGASLTSGQTRGVGAAGRGARAAARRAGRDPDEIARVGEEAEREAEVKALQRNLMMANEDLSKLRTRKGRVLADLRRLLSSRTGNPAAKKRLARSYRSKLRQITIEMAEVREVRAEIVARLDEIGESVVAESYEASYEAGQAADTAASSEAAEPSADAQAMLDQANTARQTAERAAATNESFIRTLFGSSSIDPGMGGVTVNVKVEGSLVQQGELARFIVGALGGQGAVPASSFASPA